MKKIFYKLVALGSLITSFSLVGDTEKETQTIQFKKIEKKQEPLNTKSNLNNKEKKSPALTEEKTPVSSKTDSLTSRSEIKNFFNLIQEHQPLTFKLPKSFDKITLPSTQEIQEFLKDYTSFLLPDETATTNLLTFRLMAPTYLFESTKTSVDKHGIISTEPLECFYFCTSDALTIGYGSKIEYKDGKLCKEGYELLQHIELQKDGHFLTMEEKIELVDFCFEQKRAYDQKHTGKLRNKLFEAQKKILFPTGAPFITKENAFHVAQIEYQDKMNRILKDNPVLGSSYFSLSLATDLAFQCGNAGVKRTAYYKLAKNKKTLASSIQIGANDRLKLRKLLCTMAHRQQIDQAKRKGKPASTTEQNAFTLYALQSFCNTFKSSIMARDHHTILLMQEFMTLVFMQNKKNEVQRPLTYNELSIAAAQAQEFVYQDVFQSPTVAQLPHKIRPITILNAVKKIQPFVQLGKENKKVYLKPKYCLKEALIKESLIQLQKYNKKHKTAHQLTLSQDAILHTNNNR